MAQTPRASTVGGRTLPHTDPRLFKTPTVISSAAVPTVSASTSRKTATAGGGGAGGGSTKPIRWLGRDAEVGQALDEPTSSSRGAHLASGPVGDGSPVLVVKRAMPREAGSKRALEKSKLGWVPLNFRRIAFSSYCSLLCLAGWLTLWNASRSTRIAMAA